MLKVLQIRYTNFSPLDTGELLFKRNPILQFTIEAPAYWWLDVEWPVYCKDFHLSEPKFCFDEWEDHSVIIQSITMAISNFLALREFNFRKLIQILPLSTNLVATIDLSYQQIVEVCENYVAGEYKYVAPVSLPNEREWKDFCETLLDLKGVRDLVEDE